MKVKDYYKTLGVSPKASGKEIQQSFRKLAMIHHPDKNPGQAQSESLFREIQEAYEVLSDPRQREEYNYKRWYQRSLGKAYQADSHTPFSIMKESELLASYVESMNIFQLDYEALNHHLLHLLSDEHLNILQQSGDTATCRRVVGCVVESAQALPNGYIPHLASLLKKVAGQDRASLDQIEEFVRWHQKSAFWKKWRVPFILAATLLICLVIYRLSS